MKLEDVTIKQQLELGQRMVSREQAESMCFRDCFKDGREQTFCSPCLNALFHQDKLEILSEEKITEICNEKLTREDVEGVCDSPSVCFCDDGDEDPNQFVRCGPCALRRYHTKNSE